jgi:enamine deaminase RidA (YjgF/YER057c/UK114 family)
VLLGFSTPLRAQQYIKGERPQQRGYSLAVITEGGKTVWLGGQIATVDDTASRWPATSKGSAADLQADYAGRCEKAGGKLSNMVQMTVFITDVRYGDRLTEIRREIFGDNFPGSALITVTRSPTPTQRSRFRATPSLEQVSEATDGLSPPSLPGGTKGGSEPGLEVSARYAPMRGCR